MSFSNCKSIFVVSVAIVFSLGMVACKKEYIDKVNTIPGDTLYVSGRNYISSFEVKEYSKDTILKASITADSIIVYWPTYMRALPDSIAPTIALPDSATIAPASGTKVAFKTGTTYTVTSAAGTTKKYYLKVSQQSAVPWFFYNPSTMNLGEYISVSGDQFWQDVNQTQVYLVSVATGTAYKAELFAIGLAGPKFIIPMNVPTTGLYDIKVINGIFTIYNTTEVRRNNITLTYPVDVSINDAGLPAKVSRGGSFTVRGTLLTNVVSAELYNSSSTYVPIEVVSTAVDRVVLRIPAGQALGIYTRIRVTTSTPVSRIVSFPMTIIE